MSTRTVQLGHRFTAVFQGDSLIQGYQSTGGTVYGSAYQAHELMLNRISSDLAHTHTTHLWHAATTTGYTGYTVDGVFTRNDPVVGSGDGTGWLEAQGPVEVWNCAQGGTRSDLTYSSSPRGPLPTEAEVTGRRGAPDLHLISYGTNDSFMGFSHSKFQDGIQDRVNEFPNAAQVLLVMPWIPSNGWMSQTEYDNYLQALYDVQTDTPAMDIDVVVIDDTYQDDGVDSDGVHLNGPGAADWYRQIRPHLKVT